MADGERARCEVRPAARRPRSSARPERPARSRSDKPGRPACRRSHRSRASRGRLPMPSICPLICRCSLPSPSTAKYLELDARGAGVDDEDRVHGDHAAAVGARCAAAHRRRAPPPRRRPSAPAPSPRATSGRSARGRRARCRRIGLGEEGQVLRQHVAGLRDPARPGSGRGPRPPT